MRTLLTLVLVCGAVTNAAAQWYVGVEVSTTRYGGSSHDTSGAHTASDGRPGDATVWQLRVGKNWQRFGVALRAGRSKPGLAITGQGVNVTDKTAGSLSEIAAIGTVRVGGIGPSGAVRVEVGPALHLWDFDGEYRKRIGAVAAAAYEWPVSARFTGSVRLEGMLSSSWFDATDVPPEFERHATWRYGVGLGLRYRLSGG